MTVSIFVDTTILLYARDASEPEKQPLAAAWLEALWDRQCGRLSFQVLEECYTRLARKMEDDVNPVEEFVQVCDVEIDFQQPGAGSCHVGGV